MQRPKWDPEAPTGAAAGYAVLAIGVALIVLVTAVVLSRVGCR